MFGFESRLAKIKDSQCIITFSWTFNLFVAISLVRIVVDVGAVVASISRTVFTAADTTDVAGVDDSVATTVAVVAVDSNNSVDVPTLTINFGAVEPDVDCDDDVYNSVDAMAGEEELEVEEVDDDNSGGDGVDVAFSVTISSKLCYI